MGNPVKFHLHHKDGNHMNNELDNLQILCPNCHSMTDNYGVYNSDRYKQRCYCNECGKEIRKNKTGLCIDCYHKFRSVNSKLHKNKKYIKELCPICQTNYKDIRSKTCIECSNKSRIHDLSNVITRNTLKDLIRTKPFTIIAKEYNVTDNAIRKWCIKYNLPKRTKDIKSYTDEEWIYI